MIVLAWVNDEDTKRAYGSSDDAYPVFHHMSEFWQASFFWVDKATRRELNGHISPPMSPDCSLAANGA